jgi:hypothetical protein
MSDPNPLQPIVTVEPSYPALTVFARHGEVAAWMTAGAGLVTLTALLYSQLGWAALGPALAVAGLLYGATRLLGDIARLLVETLIPK